MRPAPNLSGSVDAEFIHGLANVDGRMMILLNVDELVGRELSSVESPRMTGTN